MTEQSEQGLERSTVPLSQYDREHIGDLVAGEGDWFTAQLIRLIAKADSGNRARLAQGFPEEVEAYKRWYYGEEQEGRTG